jgi:hypothetical protein
VGGDIEIISGSALETTAGNIHIYAGKNENTNVYGKIYVGTGSAGTNPLAEAGGSDTSVLCYNPSTGEVTHATADSLTIAYSVAL